MRRQAGTQQDGLDDAALHHSPRWPCCHSRHPCGPATDRSRLQRTTACIAPPCTCRSCRRSLRPCHCGGKTGSEVRAKAAGGPVAVCLSTCSCQQLHICTTAGNAPDGSNVVTCTHNRRAGSGKSVQVLLQLPRASDMHNPATTLQAVAMRAGRVDASPACCTCLPGAGTPGDSNSGAWPTHLLRRFCPATHSRNCLCGWTMRPSPAAARMCVCQQQRMMIVGVSRQAQLHSLPTHVEGGPSALPLSRRLLCCSCAAAQQQGSQTPRDQCCCCAARHHAASTLCCTQLRVPGGGCALYALMC